MLRSSRKRGGYRPVNGGTVIEDALIGLSVSRDCRAIGGRNRRPLEMMYGSGEVITGKSITGGGLDVPVDGGAASKRTVVASSVVSCGGSLPG